MSEFEWELSKENVQPLRGGRDVAKLNAALSARAGPRDSEIAAFEAAIKEAASGKEPNASDPLKPWVSYIDWLRESYPKGSPRIARAIERACYTFKGSRRYKDDPRYVRLWVLYIAPREDQLDVFMYMRSKGIGYHSALFYEAWANTLERAHMFEKAQAAYELGQKRGAVPTDRLEARLNGFHARMAARKRRDEARARKATAKARSGGPSARPRPNRQALVSLGSNSRSAPPPTQPQLRGHISVDPLDQLRSLKPVLNGDSFEVFNDSEAGSIQPENLLDGTEGEELPFPSVVFHEQNTRENRMEPEQWRGAVIKQDSKLIQQIQNRMGLAPPFEVYRDPLGSSENALDDENTNHMEAQEPLESFREKMSELAEAEAAENVKIKVESPSSLKRTPGHGGLSESFEAQVTKQAEIVELSKSYVKVQNGLANGKPARKLIDLSPIPEAFEVYRSTDDTCTLAAASSDSREENKPVYKKFSNCEDKDEFFDVIQNEKSSPIADSFQVYRDASVQASKPQALTAIPVSPPVIPGSSTGLTPQFESLSIDSEEQENGICDSSSKPVKRSKKINVMAELNGFFTSVPERESSNHEGDQNASENVHVHPDRPPAQTSFAVYQDNANLPVQKTFESCEDIAAKENVPMERHDSGEHVAPSRPKILSEKKKKGLAVRDQENFPRSEVPSPPSSPAPQQRNSTLPRGASPTINTKIATRDIENMFSMPLPHEEEDEFTLLNCPDNSVTETFEVYRDPAHETSGFRQEEPMEVFQNPGKPSPGSYTAGANASSDDEDDDDKFVLRPGGQGSFSVFNEIFASMTKENNSEDAFEPSKESQRRLERDDVLNPIAALEGIASPERLISISGPSQKKSKNSGLNTSSFLQEWCKLERDYYVLDNALVQVKEGQFLFLDIGHGDIRKISVDAVAGKGYRGAANVFVASVANRSDLEGFGPGKSHDNVFSLKVQRSNALEFYIYRALQDRIGRRVSDIPIAMAVFDDQSISRSAMLINCVSDGSMAEILRLTPRNCFAETVALFFTVAILRAVEAVHECGIIHTDVTLDNLLLRNEDRPLTSPRYCTDGANGWDQIGVFLVDFNMAFDSRHSSIEDSSPASIAQIVSMGQNEHVIPEYRKVGSSLWAFDADCHALSVCTAKMLGLNGRDLESCHRLLRHETIWNTFFREMSALTHLSTPRETISAMQRNRMAMESVLVKDFSLKSSLTKVMMRIAEAKYAEDVTKTIGI